MTVSIHTLCVGPLEVNCYIVGCSAHNVCLVIDPGDSSGRILDKVNDLGWSVAKIVNTHGHADHVGANRKVKEATGAPICVHIDEKPIFAHPDMEDMAAYMGLGTSPEPDEYFNDGDVIAICDCSGLTVIHTPGHTPGGVCLLHDKDLITGDTLFRLSIGRTDLLGGDDAAMRRTLKEIIYPLDDDLTIYPGHGETSLLGEEKRLNPYLVQSR